MTLQQVVILALQASIVLTVFGFGLGATLRDLQYLVRRPGLLARSLLAMFVIMPIAALVLNRILPLRPVLKIALVALAISPVPPLLPMKETKAGGESAYALGLMMVVSLLAIVVMPLWAQWLAWFAGREIQAPPGVIATTLITMIVLPLVAGAVIRRNAPAAAARLARPTKLVSTVLLVVSVAVLVAASFRAVVELIDVTSVLAIAVFVAIGLAAGHWLGGPQPDEATVLALSTASRHPAIALAVSKINFPDEPLLGATILLYLILSAFLSVPYVVRQRSVLVPRPS
jgi:BASS family bile acid:Na+ symporter